MLLQKLAMTPLCNHDNRPTDHIQNGMHYHHAYKPITKIARSLTCVCLYHHWHLFPPFAFASYSTTAHSKAEQRCLLKSTPAPWTKSVPPAGGLVYLDSQDL